MATGGGPPRKNDKKNSSKNDVGTWMAVGAGIALAAGAAYVGKKLFDYVTADKEESRSARMAESKEQEIQDFYFHDDAYRDVQMEGKDPVQNVSSSLAKISMEDLQNSLHDYYNNYADIPPTDMNEASEVVNAIKAALLQYFADKRPSLGITSMINTGSCSEGLKVIRPDEFDVMFPVYLDGKKWRLVHGRNTELNASGFYFVERINTEKYPKQADGLDKFLDEDNYLSPLKIIRACQGYVDTAISLFKDTLFKKYVIKRSTHGPAVTLDVTYLEDKHLDIDFVPALVLDHLWVVAKQHHRAIEDADYEHLWRESFSTKERGRLMSLPEGRCHLMVLKIMKAIRLNHHAQFGMLSSYVYKTVLMHMLDDTDEEMWHDDCLQERFKDMLHTLAGNLEAKQLKHFYCDGINLLDDVPKIACTELRNYINNTIGKNRFNKLLDVQNY